MALRTYHNLGRPLIAPINMIKTASRKCNFPFQNCSLDPRHSHKKWRREFRVSDLTEESVKIVAETGKSYVHDFLDLYDRPVPVVLASKHFPDMHDPVENEKRCVFLVEKALAKLPAGKEQILGVFDLRDFSTENADLKFFTFVFDMFYYYYPIRLGEVLFVDAPFIFKPFWQLAKLLLK